MRLRAESDGEPAQSRYLTGFGISGLAAGTEVLTDSGWLFVERLVEGDIVMTFDRGPAPLTSVRSRTFGANISTFWPNGILYVPAGALGPADAYYLLPAQQITLPSEISAAMFDDPSASVPASALVGVRGICRVMPVDLLEVVELRLPRDAGIAIRGGVWALCPGVSARVRSMPLRRGPLPRAGAA